MLCNYYIMGRPNKLKEALNQMIQYFQGVPLRAFTYKRLQTTIDNQKTYWDIPYHRQAKDIIKFLVKEEFFLETRLSLEHGQGFTIYTWKTKDEFTVASGIKPNTYFMYYSALFLHGLTQQLPKTYYLNAEHHSQNRTGNSENKLSQQGIDLAFSKEQRKSELVYLLENKRIILTNTKNTDRLGVIENRNDQQLFYYTDLERTLIDCVVRPAYAGGVFEILEAYKLAKGKIDPKKLYDYLQELDYTYPYAQSIGFYMEKAGYSDTDTQLFQQKKAFDFYLTYNIRNKEYNERWGLFYPRGF
jgi:predicted transcriptional regulator of viral defense system